MDVKWYLFYIQKNISIVPRVEIKFKQCMKSNSLVSKDCNVAPWMKYLAGTGVKHFYVKAGSVPRPETLHISLFSTVELHWNLRSGSYVFFTPTQTAVEYVSMCVSWFNSHSFNAEATHSYYSGERGIKHFSSFSWEATFVLVSLKFN